MLDVAGYLDRSKAAGEVFPREGTKPVPPFKLVRDMATLGFSDAILEWLERIDSLQPDTLRTVFERFPDGWISDAAADFAVCMLQKTPQLMREELE